MERMLQEYSTLMYRTSIVAAAAVALAMNNPDVSDLEGSDSDNDEPKLVTASKSHQAAIVSSCKYGPLLRVTDMFSASHSRFQPAALLKYSDFKVEDIKKAAELVQGTVGVQAATKARRKLEAVKRKYESERYDSVSETVLIFCFSICWNYA